MLNLLVITGIIAWSAATVSRLTRRFWPVRRGIPPLMRAELIFGGASLILLAAAGPARLAREAASGCLSAAITCGLLTAGTMAWRRHRNGTPVVRLRRRIPGSHVYIWVDVMCATVAALAAPLAFPRSGSTLADAIVAVTGTGAAGLVTGISQSVRLHRHNRAASHVSLRTTP